LKVSKALDPNSERPMERRKALMKKLKNCGFEKKLTPLGKCLFGLGKKLLL
jgi:hypothetical protein